MFTTVKLSLNELIEITFLPYHELLKYYAY